MKAIRVAILGCLFVVGISAQTDLEKLSAAEKGFERLAAGQGMKAAFLEFLADDSVIFHPNAVNGREFWRAFDDGTKPRLIRTPLFTDIASNGGMGYTTGSWELWPLGKSGSDTRFGQYTTVWERKSDGRYLATLDIEIGHANPGETKDKMQRTFGIPSRDINKRGWSVADASMNFLRMSMKLDGLSSAYERFAAKDVRLLRDREPPIIGKRKVVNETRNYISVAFPSTIASYQSGDMAYTWNACEFANSNEGRENGNCLHIWKLRNKKWWIVIGVFAPLPNDTPPVLKPNPKKKTQR